MYTWKVLYKDGTTISEVEDGKENAIGKIEFDNAEKISIISNDKPMHELLVGDSRPFGFARRVVASNGYKATIWVFGLDFGNNKIYMFVHPNGSVQVKTRDGG